MWIGRVLFLAEEAENLAEVPSLVVGGPKVFQALDHNPSSPRANHNHVLSHRGLPKRQRIIHWVYGHQPFMWTREVEEGFRLLKQKIIEKPILALAYVLKLFEVNCDASGMAIGDFLSQEEKLI